MLKGRLGLEKSRIPHADRHGHLWLGYGALSVEDGCLKFVTAGWGEIQAGDYRIPHQTISTVLLGPGTSISHDAFRLLAASGGSLCIVGEDGVRIYTAPPLIPDQSDVARSHARLWANETKRLDTARRMYAWRLDEVLPHRDIAILRGIEGSRVKESYKLAAQRHGISWSGRRYDRQSPDASDEPNTALNHASTAVEAAAAIAVYSVGAIPQLGFIHEHSGHSFVLDIADLYRESVTIDCAFAAVRSPDKDRFGLERVTRKMVGQTLRAAKIIPSMIDKIKILLDEGPT